MHFSRIAVRNFRNYNNLELTLNPGVNLFVGHNGQGKTNLIEALYLLVKGESFRPGKAEVWLRQSEDARSEFGLITAEAERKGLNYKIEWRFQHGQKQFLLNEKRVSRSTLSTLFPTILFSPESLAAIKEGPDERRALADELLLTMGDGKSVIEFKNALRSRNRLLRDFKEGIYSQNQILELLEAFDQVYLPIAARLTFARIQRLRALEPFLRKAVAFISPQDLVDISVDYEISDVSAHEWDLAEVLENLRNRMKTLKNSELQSGSTLVGPHKHQVNFLSGRNDARYFCSQGQQRAVILGFKMAQIMYHHQVFQIHPLLLLDDVLSELDPVKGSNLLKFLEGIQSQILLTTTDISFPFDFSSRGMSVYRLNQGAVEELRV